MKTFTKLMLTLAMLVGVVGGVNSVKAGNHYADLSKLSNGPVSTWNAETNTITWTGKSNNMISNFDFAAGDYRTYSKIGVVVSSFSNASSVRVQIRANGVEKTAVFSGVGTIEKSLIDDYGFTVADLKHVEWIRMLGSTWDDGHTIDAENPASAVINNVYLYQPTNTLNVNLSSMAASNDNATWNKDTKVFAWTLNYSNAITLPGLSGNLSSFSRINYDTEAGTSDAFRILIYYTNGASQTTYIANVGNKSVAFKDMGVSEENLAHVSSIMFSGAPTSSGDVILNSFSLEGPSLKFIETATVQEAPVGMKDINGMTGEGAIKWDVTYPKMLGPGTGWCGDIDSEGKSVNITGYDYLHFVVSDASDDVHLGMRVFVSDGSTRTTLFAHPIAEAGSVVDWQAVSYITSPGVYVVKITDYSNLRGFKTSNAWDDGNSHRGSATISLAYVGSGSPVSPVDKVVRLGEDILTDPHATCFDVTGLEESGITLNPANPNALFIAKAGELTNAQNVIVDDVCANLVLTDNHPFKAPADFTATTATYNTTINTTAKAGTLYLPYAAAIPSGVKAYTLTYTSGSEVTATEITTGTIPANTPVLLNGEGSTAFTGSGVAIAADGAFASGALTGVLEQGFVPKDSYVLQNGDSGLGFYKVAADNTIGIKPFRAYLTATGGGSRVAINFADETTGINAVQGSDVKVNGSEAVYNLQGQRVAQPTKGLYIVNGKKVIVK